MTRKPFMRRLTIAATILVVGALMGLGLGSAARAIAGSGKTQHKLSKIVPYVAGKNLFISIEHPFFDNSAQVKWALLKDKAGTKLGYLLPIPTNGRRTGQVVKNNRLTVNFDTTSATCLQPPTWDPTTAPGTGLAMPALGSGAIIIISTDGSSTDTAPDDPITIEQVPITD